jgi:hypothetical protein
MTMMISHERDFTKIFCSSTPPIVRKNNQFELAECRHVSEIEFRNRNRIVYGDEFYLSGLWTGRAGLTSHFFK